jgi:hypothetical protein
VGDVLTVLEDTEEGWWKGSQSHFVCRYWSFRVFAEMFVEIGKKEDGSVGIFPGHPICIFVSKRELFIKGLFV